MHLGTSQGCFPSGRKGKERRQFYFLKAEKSWLPEKWGGHHFSSLLVPPGMVHTGEAFPLGCVQRGVDGVTVW